MSLARSLPACAAVLLAPAGPAAAADGFMSLQDFQFAPTAVQIQPGEKVDFNFEGPSTHNAVIVRHQTDRYDSGITGPGRTKSHRFVHAGSFRLICDIHPQMKARVTVGARETLRPRLSRVRARTGSRSVRLAFRVSERSVVSAAVGTRRATKVVAPGAGSLTLRGLRAGRRTARLTAKDGWGNRSAALRKSFRIR
jgi:plastocyanin